jgi:t-SNARE complex subunit (syntaxin)
MRFCFALEKGEMIDRIEFNVVQSENFVKAASTDTKKAVKFQSAARRVSLTISMLCM